MLKLKKELRDQIVSYLTSITVPAQVGSNLIEITKALSSLEEIKEEPAQPSVVDEKA